MLKIVICVFAAFGFIELLRELINGFSKRRLDVRFDIYLLSAKNAEQAIRILESHNRDFSEGDVRIILSHNIMLDDGELDELYREFRNIYRE